MGKSKALLGLLALAAVTVAPGVSAEVGRASEGYVYFHRAGATEAQHHEALAACVEKARSLRWVNPAVFQKKLADAIVADGYIVGGARRQLKANLENCMVAEGWEVVSVDPAEGARLAALPQDRLAAELGPLIGAATVAKGEVVRRYAPMTDYFNGQYYLGNDSKGTSLSVLADAAVSRTVAEANTSKVIYADSATPLIPSALLAPTAPGDVPPGATVIVVRAVAESHGGFDVVLSRADEDDKGVARSVVLLQALAHQPKRMLDKFGPDELLVFVVPPGRWRVFGSSLLTFCLGAPGFDVAEGQAVFAGTFHGRAGAALAVDTASEAVKARLPAELAGRLTPAKWLDDGPKACGAKPQPYWYMDRLEFAGVS